MYQVTFDEAAIRLPELLRQVEAGEEVWIMREETQIARLLPPEPKPTRPRPKRGSHKGQVLYVAPDIDDLPEGFEEYFS